MRMVRRADHHGVDARLFEQLAKVGVRLRVREPGTGRTHKAVVDVAHSDDVFALDAFDVSERSARRADDAELHELAHAAPAHDALDHRVR